MVWWLVKESLGNWLQSCHIMCLAVRGIYPTWSILEGRRWPHESTKKKSTKKCVWWPGVLQAYIQQSYTSHYFQKYFPMSMINLINFQSRFSHTMGFQSPVYGPKGHRASQDFYFSSDDWTIHLKWTSLENLFPNIGSFKAKSSGQNFHSNIVFPLLCLSLAGDTREFPSPSPSYDWCRKWVWSSWQSENIDTQLSVSWKSENLKILTHNWVFPGEV